MLPKNKIFLAVGVFFLSYALFLAIWVQVKPFYGSLLAHVGAPLAAWTTGARLDEIVHGKEVADLIFYYFAVTSQGSGDVLIDVKIAVSNYSFNVPLTFSLIAALFVFFRWRPGALLEAGLILVLIHLSYIYFHCTLQIFYQLAMGQIFVPPKWVQFLLQFMWGFTDNLIIRFEPFLITVYLWMRRLLSKPAPALEAAAPVAKKRSAKKKGPKASVGRSRKKSR
jgi:hypothetical protein